MAVEYRASTVTNMDMEDSKVGYKQLFSDGGKLKYSVYALKNSPFRIAAACLGLLCVFLLAGVIGQSVHYQKVVQRQQNDLKAVTKERDNLQVDLKVTQKGKKDLQTIQTQLQQRNERLTTRIDQIQANNNLLSEEAGKIKLSQSQLQTSNADLTREKDQLKESNDQLQTNNKALSTAKDLLQKQYDSVLKRKNELQANVASLTRDRDNLQNRHNNVTRAKEQMQLDYNKLIKDLEHLQDRYNSSSSEKEKLESSHQNLTTSKETLQATYNALVKATDELRASYASLLREKDEAENNCKNVTNERDSLKVMNTNLTAERDLLQGEIVKLSGLVQDKKCPTGWKKFKMSCYYTSAGKKKWQQGREYCQSKGADLAVIKSQEEMAFINGLYGSDKEVWIGLTDGGVEGQWRWVDGTPLTTTFWAKGQPNSHDGRNQDCVEFWHRGTGDGEWNDENCNIEQQWICEM
ncbi:uncharacterized protein V6R79_026373 [Siganus canaliculatus]